jgi:NAD(P)-dependent dehydrogenase (short-subunit alcohol dehydrogenase family)
MDDQEYRLSPDSAPGDAAAERPEAAAPVAVVTGADGGIGQAVAARLAADGFDLVVHHLGEPSDGLRRLCARVEQLGRRCAAVAGDFSDAAAAQRPMALAMERFGRADVLVNNAAWAPGAVALDQCSAEILDRVWAVNVRAPLLLSGEFVKQARVRRMSGSIVNISSIHACHSVPGHVTYAASKGAIGALTRQLAVELGPLGIRVNAVAPGFVEVARTTQGRNPADLARMANRTPLGRNGQPEDVAALVAFLCSDQSRHITGQTYTIDGGTSCVLSTHPLGPEDA